jgi:hypothetical protein
MARIGSVAAAPFVGDQFVSLYLGEERVPTVPGKPVNLTAVFDGDAWNLEWGAPANDGGSTVLDYKIYVEGVLDADAQVSVSENNATTSATTDAEVSVSAVNAIGEGPQSAPLLITEE